MTTSRLWIRATIAIIVAAVLNVGVGAVEAAAFGISPEFLALQPGPIVFSTALGMLAGTIVYAGLRRRVRRPARTFAIVASIAALLSLAAPLALAFDTSGQFTGSSVPAGLALIPLHLIPAVALVLGLTVAAPATREVAA